LRGRWYLWYIYIAMRRLFIKIKIYIILPLFLAYAIYWCAIDYIACAAGAFITPFDFIFFIFSIFHYRHYAADIFFDIFTLINMCRCFHYAYPFFFFIERCCHWWVQVRLSLLKIRCFSLPLSFSYTVSWEKISSDISLFRFIDYFFHYFAILFSFSFFMILIEDDSHFLLFSLLFISSFLTFSHITLMRSIFAIIDIIFAAFLWLSLRHIDIYAYFFEVRLRHHCRHLERVPLPFSIADYEPL